MRKIHPKQPKRPRVKTEAQRDREARVVEKRRAKIEANESPYRSLTEEPTNDR